MTDISEYKTTNDVALVERRGRPRLSDAVHLKRKQERDKRRKGRAELRGWGKRASRVNESTYVRKSCIQTGRVTAVGLKRAWDSTRGRCSYCNAPLTLSKRCINTVRWDHLIPLSRGGSHHDKNMAPSCGLCNLQKSSLTANEFRLVIAGLLTPIFGMLRAVHALSRNA